MRCSVGQKTNPKWPLRYFRHDFRLTVEIKAIDFTIGYVGHPKCTSMPAWCFEKKKAFS